MCFALSLFGDENDNFLLYFFSFLFSKSRTHIFCDKRKKRQRKNEHFPFLNSVEESSEQQNTALVCYPYQTVRQYPYTNTVDCTIIASIYHLRLLYTVQPCSANKPVLRHRIIQKNTNTCHPIHIFLQTCVSFSVISHSPTATSHNPVTQTTTANDTPSPRTKKIKKP